MIIFDPLSFSFSLTFSPSPNSASCFLPSLLHFTLQFSYVSYYFKMATFLWFKPKAMIINNFTNRSVIYPTGSMILPSAMAEF